MRLFTGIDLPGHVVEALERLLERLKPAARLNWSHPENLHVTTKFIGEWPAERLEEMKRVLAGVPSPGPISIAIRKLGYFPSARSPRVFWAGIEAGPGLATLAKDTDAAVARLGVEAEKRAFSPHLTLARIKEPAPLDDLRETIAGLGPLEFGEFTADRFHLYQSQLRPAGSVYTKLAEFPL